MYYILHNYSFSKPSMCSKYKSKCMEEAKHTSYGRSSLYLENVAIFVVFNSTKLAPNFLRKIKFDAH